MELISRCVSTVHQRTSSLSENTLLLNFLLGIASRFQTELIDSSHTSVSWMRGSEYGNRASGSYSSCEVQTNAFTMISEVYLRVGTYLPVDHWQSTVEVAGFVAALRMFFNYGLTHKSQTVLIVTSQKEDTATSLNTNLTYSGPYKPPYLRKKDQKLLQLIEPDSMVFSYHEFSSVDHMLSDSDYSDSDGSPKEAFNITSSKARVVAIVCLQVTQELFVCKQEGNNSLENYREFVAIFVHLKKLGNDDHLHKAFAFFDHNKNRYIEIEELREALADEVDTNSEEVINAIIQDVDTDKDGRISYEEFAAMMKAGTDWRKASRQYSRERYNSLSLTLMRDGSLKVKDEGR